MKEGLPFARDLSLENSADSYLCFRLALHHSVSYFFFLYRSPSSSLCTVFDSISSNIDEVLSINPSANVFVFGDFNVHHKDWLTYSGGTDRPGELCYNFSISNDLTQIVNFPTRIPDCDSHSPALSDLFLSSDASICSTMAFPPLGNSDHVVVSVSIDFPIKSKQNTPFHRMAYDYSRADWDGLRDHLRDVPWEDTFKLSASGAASEFCEWVQVGIDVYISHRKYQVKPHSSPWFSAACAAAIVHRNRLYQQNQSSESKVKFSQASNRCKRVLEATKLAYATKTKESITSQKLGSRDFWRIANSVTNKGRSAIPPLFNGLEVLSSTSDKAKLFAKNFSKNSNLDDSGISLPLFPSRTNLKLHNISITPKMVKKVITNLDSSKASGPDCIPVVVLKNCEPELSYILAKLFNKCLKESCFPNCWKVSSVVPVFKNVGERSTAKNYHPVSLLSVVSEVFEKLVNNRIVDHLEKCGLFSDSISSNIDEVLSINPSANVFVFGDFNVHHKDWLTYSGGTDRPGELCYNFSISNDLTQIVNFPTRIPDCDSHSPALSDLFLSSDASICSTMAFPPLGNSDHVVVSVSIDFPIKSKQNTPFHRMAYDYSRADWDGLRDHLRDVPWEDTFKLSASGAASEFCEWVQVGIDVYISHRKYQVKPHSSPWFSAACAAAIVHRNRLYQQNQSSESKVKFSQASNRCKRVLEATKLAYATKTKESITSQKLGSRDFWRIANSVTNKGRSAIPPLFNGLEVLSSTSDKAKLFAKNFSKNSNLDDSGISLPLFPSRTNLKLHNISITPKMVKKVITNLDSSKASGPDCIPVVVLKNCEPELSYILAKLFNKCLKESCFPNCWKVSSVVPVFKNVGERSTAKNYHPVSLLSVVSEVFEKLVNNRIVDHLEKCGLFSDFQYGFRSSRSTADLLTVVSDRIARAFNRSRAT